MPELSTGIGDMSAALAIVDLSKSRSHRRVKTENLEDC